MGIPKSLFCATVASLLTLTGCGGGSSPVTPSQTGQTLSCELPLKYADGSSNGSGYAIRPSAQSVGRQFNTCAIAQVQSASLSLCIDHLQISELSVLVVLPNNTTLPLDLQSAQTTGAACLVGGKLFTMAWPLTDVQALRSLQGSWAVRVTDNNAISSTPIGTLVGWSLNVEGTP